jgi:prolyl oligopeptidase
VLDLDDLSLAENENWVMKGIKCLIPQTSRCLLLLSRGGKDAVVIREYDIEAKSFVTAGFQTSEGKSSADWVDADTLIISPDLGPDSVTASGYPNETLIWKRGTPLSAAIRVQKVPNEHVSSSSTVFRSTAGTVILAINAVDFFTEVASLVTSDGVLRALDLPSGSEVKTVLNNILVVSLRNDLALDGKTIPAGSLLGYSLDKRVQPEILFQPSDTTFLLNVTRAGDSLILSLLSNVTSKLKVLSNTAGKWQSRDLRVPELGLSAVAASSADKESFYILSQSLLMPPQLGFVSPTLTESGELSGYTEIPVRKMPDQFNVNEFKVEQIFATSPDGTRVPAFLVHKKGLVLDGTNPTLLYGYGGFEISLTPSYLGRIGKVWLENGGVYVIANLRGGGEYGPKWHQAALKENRQRAYDDFIAIAESLIARGITSPGHLGIRGGSNGGLLVGAVMVQRPDLSKAVVCDVPLLDMLRYNKLGAGASWEAEYGDPLDQTKPAAAAIRRYSPYQNVRSGVQMPSVLFTTSTRDDRVHPSHARKMAALMIEQQQDALLFENTEGGHGGAANLEQQALMDAFRYTHLLRQLKP